MGLYLKEAVLDLLDSMGEYCFPNGRPTLSFETPKWNVTQNLTNVDSDFSALRIDKGGELTIHLTAQSGFELDTVTVEMGNVDITSTAYDSGVVHILQVTGDVVVTASCRGTYVANGLVFRLDGLDTGQTSGKWTDLVGGIEFTNHGAAKVATGWDFDGSSYMDSSSPLSGMDWNNGTLEVCFTSRLTGQAYFILAAAQSDLVMCFAPAASLSGDDADGYVYRRTTNSGATENYGIIKASAVNVDNGIGAKIVSFNMTNGGLLNGVVKGSGGTYYSADAETRIGCRLKNNVNERFFDGIIHAIRYYDRDLTPQEMLANQKLDNERFNLGLTIE